MASAAASVTSSSSVDQACSHPSIEAASSGRSAKSSKKGAMSSHRALARLAGDEGKTDAVKVNPREWSGIEYPEARVESRGPPRARDSRPSTRDGSDAEIYADAPGLTIPVGAGGDARYAADSACRSGGADPHGGPGRSAAGWGAAPL